VAIVWTGRIAYESWNYWTYWIREHFRSSDCVQQHFKYEGTLWGNVV